MSPVPTVPYSQRLSPRVWVALDVLLAAFLLSITIASVTVQETKTLATPKWDALRIAAALLACGALPLRRRWPFGVLVATTIGDAILGALAIRGPGQVAVAFAMFTVAASSTRRDSLRLAGVVAAVMLFAALIVPGGPEWSGTIAGPAVVLLGWVAGENARVRRAHTQTLVEQAEQRERQRDARARQAATDERVRIARELHDIVAHAMSLIAVRAGAARMVIDEHPGEAREALSIIETTSRQALREMRRLVGVLRDPDPAVRGQLEPAAGLADLDELVSQVADAGVRVELEVTGPVRPLPEGIDLSAYRIVQEALTNVVRHAGPTTAHLRVRYGTNALEIDLLDDGPAEGEAPTPANGQGHGLVGMRERVGLYDGELVTGRAGRGYRVVARLPIDEDRP
jgi:signal transduction histidine kinase